MPEQLKPDEGVLRSLTPRLPGVPIFNYHGLAGSLSDDIPLASRPFWLSPTKFRSHLSHILHSGFRAILLDALKDSARSHVPGQRSVALTFDDGLSSDYEIAFPILEDFGIHATFFLNTETIGQAGYLDWARIAEMQRHGMSFQSHSHRHVDLTVLPDTALDAELTESKQRLEDHLGAQVNYIAAPRGVLDRRVVRRALTLGYRAACSTRCLPARPGSVILTRITLRRDIEIEEFHCFLSGDVWPYARRLWRGLLLRPVNAANHLYGVLRYRWLKQSAAVTK